MDKTDLIEKRKFSLENNVNVGIINKVINLEDHNIPVSVLEFIFYDENFNSKNLTSTLGVRNTDYILVNQNNGLCHLNIFLFGTESAIALNVSSRIPRKIREEIIPHKDGTMFHVSEAKEIMPLLLESGKPGYAITNEDYKSLLSQDTIDKSSKLFTSLNKKYPWLLPTLISVVGVKEIA